MRHLLGIVLLLFLTGCTDEEKARRHLEQSGYTSISVGGWEPNECAREDLTSTRFRATASDGKIVIGVVCCRARTCEIRR